MAYSLAPRFPPPPKYFTLLDPGSYSHGERSRTKNNAAPFLSKAPRITDDGAKVWTQAVYDQTLPNNTPNYASMLSKKPRFPYEAFSAKDLEEILCKCGISSPCECPTGEEILEDVACQGKIKRRLFKGIVPRSPFGDEGMSAPSRNDHGFNISPEGTQLRMRDEIKKPCPPFYDTTVMESTAFYQGCKWNHRTAREQKTIEITPGPADYHFEREPTVDEICAEKIRAMKRKTTKQLRFMEMVQQRNILENRPSPATYRPMSPKGTDLRFIGPKAKRFLNPKSKYDISPGPADHWLRRDFDTITPGELCHAKLPKPACFGVKANRFRTRREEGPSPATYHVNTKLCNFVKCPTAPFGSSAKRFKQDILEECDDDDIIPLDKNSKAKPCILPSWEFKSKTIRMKPLVKKLDEPSPADLPLSRLSSKIYSQFQSPVHFSSSEERFLPWYSWIPVHGLLDTPGPGYYCLEKPRCYPAFKHGPLFRSKRFPDIHERAPPPNEYKVCHGIETILATHNHKLKCNIENKYKFKWQQPKQKVVLSFEEREKLLLAKCISILDTGDEEHSKSEKQAEGEEVSMTHKPKMLKSFLYAYPVPIVN